MAAAILLEYAGPDPTPRRSLAVTCWRAAVNVITATILAAVLIVRFTLLFVGFTLVVAGTLLLTLGGRRGAAKKVARWRDTAADHVRLWSADIARGARRGWHGLRGGPPRADVSSESPR